MATSLRRVLEQCGGVRFDIVIGDVGEAGVAGMSVKACVANGGAEDATEKPCNSIGGTEGASMFCDDVFETLNLF